MGVFGVRAIAREDMSGLKDVIDANELFPSEMLDEMVAGYFDDSKSDEIWLTDEDEGGVVAIAYCAPERMTEGTWNLYLIAVHPRCQGEGRGRAVVGYVEKLLAERGERLLLVETSGLPEFEDARAFYRRCGYEEEARIREFYQAGEDKIVFRKLLEAK